MLVLKRRVLVSVLLAALVPAAGSAQDLRDVCKAVPNTPRVDAGGVPRFDRAPFSHLNLQRAARRIHAERRSRSTPQIASAPKRHAIGWAIAAGIGAGVAGAGIAAARYGGNEGGAFCSRCFVEWSAFSVPIGAGIGAAIGYAIDRERR
jgi:hypothetical protein